MDQPKNPLYSDKVMEHFRNPRNVGEIEDADGIGTVGNATCGDIMQLFVKIKDGIIKDAKFKTFGCLPPNEEVVVSEGGWQSISTLPKKTPVVNSLGIETLAVEMYERKYQGKMLKIVPFVSPFNSFSLTTEHPVLSLKRSWLKRTRKSSYKCDWLRTDKKELLSSKPDYVKAKDLEIGDYLIFVVNQEVKDNAYFTKDIMRLIGYYLAEGYTSANGNVIAFSFNKKEKEYIQEVKDLLAKVSKKEAKQRTRGNVTEVYVCSKKLADFLCSVAGRLANKKCLSKEVLLLPFKKQWELIQTYLAGDGDSYRRRSHDSQTYRATTTSKNLAIQIQEMLARGGIFCSLREIYKSGCSIDGRKLKDSKMYLMTYKLKRKHNFVHFNKSYFLVPIRKIENYNFKGKVYNFQVAREPNSYLVKGFAVHNCGAAIATSSMMTELVKGKTIEEAVKISNKTVAEALDGLPPVKMHCSVLAEEALQSALEDYFTKNPDKRIPLPRLKKHKEPEGHQH